MFLWEIPVGIWCRSVHYGFKAGKPGGRIDCNAITAQQGGRHALSRMPGARELAIINEAAAA